MTLPRRAVDLFALDPSTFVAERDALVRELRASGQADDAAVVKALRRPTVAAAALNGLARDHPDLVEAVIAAGQVLARTQQRALSGVRGADVRGAVRAHHHAVAQAVEAAAAGAGAGGAVGPDGGAGRPGVGLTDDLRATLLGAATDPALAESLVAGILQRAGTTAIDPGDALGGRAPLSAVPDASAGDPGATASDTSAADEQRRRAAAELDAQIEVAERQLRQATTDRVAADRRAGMARAVEDDARADHAAADEAVAVATERLRVARTRLESAAAVLTDAEEAGAAAAARAERRAAVESRARDEVDRLHTARGAASTLAP